MDLLFLRTRAGLSYIVRECGRRETQPNYQHKQVVKYTRNFKIMTDNLKVEVKKMDRTFYVRFFYLWIKLIDTSICSVAFLYSINLLIYIHVLLHHTIFHYFLNFYRDLIYIFFRIYFFGTILEFNFNILIVSIFYIII